ncbi:O-antigen ligase family protein [Malikia spinosa]|uniref:O-antigen ligase family protein n=1 Tax=Malikia spinosa TaxID=86180 RepID=UPI002FD979FE
MENKEIVYTHKLISLILGIAIAFKILSGVSAIIIVGIFLFATAAKSGSAAAIVSISLFGLPYLKFIGSYIGLSPTQLVIALTFFTAIKTINGLSKDFFSSQFSGLRAFTKWWLILISIYSIYTIEGNASEYTAYAWQFLIIYGSFYALSGILAIKYRVSLQSVLIISLPIFAFNYTIINTTPFNLSSFADSVIGLRSEEGFDAINGARTAGMLFLMPIILIFSKGISLSLAPYLFLACLLSGPLTWYSYSRQVLIAVIFLILFIFTKTIFKSIVNKNSTIKTGLLISSITALSIGIYFLGLTFLNNNSESRLIQEGTDIGRSNLWDISIKLILENPLFGIGIGTLQQYAAHQWPHNLFIEAWLTLGFTGFILSVILSLSIIKALFSSTNDILYGWILLGFYWLTTAQFSADIPRNSILFFFLTISFYANGLFKRQSLTRSYGVNH